MSSPSTPSEADAGRTSFWADLWRDPARDFPGPLSDNVAPEALPSRGVALAVLILICLIPRVWMAWRCELVCPDAVLYLETAEALGRGDSGPLLDRFGANVYPVILALLGRTGLDPRVAGEWFSVLMATLAVVPLFGWVRRQFDDRIATFACLLYAVHPNLVFCSPLIVRDATFWFLFNLTIYLAWRAVIEIRAWLFLAAGLALSLAIHTRSEGWLLLAPLAVWIAWRMPVVAGRRVRAAAGALVCLAVVPISIVLVNVTLLHDHPRWEIARTAHVRQMGWLIRSPDESAVAPLPMGWSREGAIGPSGLVLARKVVVRFVKSYAYVFGLLTLVGLFGWWRVFVRRDQVAQSLITVLLVAAVSIKYHKGGATDAQRYFLPVVLLGLPYAALGLLRVAGWISGVVPPCFGGSFQRRPAVTCGLLLTTAAACTLHVCLIRPIAASQAELGKWIRRNLGPNQRISGNMRRFDLVVYYARGRMVKWGMPRERPAKAILETIGRKKPDVVLLWVDWRNPGELAGYAGNLQRRAELGYEQVPARRLPPSCRDVVVLVRKRPDG